MILKRLFLFLLAVVSLAFANADFVIIRDIVKQESVVKKLETAPTAFYGTITGMRIVPEEELGKYTLEGDSARLFNFFHGWAETKRNRQEKDLSRAPEIFRKTFELRNLTGWDAGFYLVNYSLLVEKVYDRATGAWVAPSGEAKKSIFTFAYVGTDISGDSTGWSLVQRLALIPFPEHSLQTNSQNKYIFFLDGFSDPVPSLDSSLENVRYFPFRVKYDIKPHYAIDVRKRLLDFVNAGEYSAALALSDSADLSLRSRILLKVLNRDYEFILNEDSVMYYRDGYNNIQYGEGLDPRLNALLKYFVEDGSYCASVKGLSGKNRERVCETVKRIAANKPPERLYVSEDKFAFDFATNFGRPFLWGDFSGVSPSLYMNFETNVLMNRWIFGMNSSIVVLDTECDSCSANDFSANVQFGFLWLKTGYVESAAFASIGVSTFEYNYGDADDYSHESYFRYGVGMYFDLLFPNYIGKPVEGSRIQSRFGLRLKFGFNNMDVSDIAQADGYSPYVSLGLTWRLVSMNPGQVKKSEKPRKRQLRYMDLECGW